MLESGREVDEEMLDGEIPELSSAADVGKWGKPQNEKE
jgi:hypothetical protein